MAIRHFEKLLVVTLATCALGLGSCGGSGSDSTVSPVPDSAVSSGKSPADETALLVKFCEAANDDSVNAVSLADDATIEEVAKQMSIRAAALNNLVNNSPSKVRSDVAAISKAASAMAESLTADSTLADFNQVIARFATSDLEAASTRVDAFIADKCQG